MRLVLFGLSFLIILLASPAFFEEKSSEPVKFPTEQVRVVSPLLEKGAISEEEKECPEEKKAEETARVLDEKNEEPLEAEKETQEGSFSFDGELYHEEAIYLAKTIFGEARGCSEEEQKKVVWCVLNRVDSAEKWFPDTIIEVVTQPNQFHGYDDDHPVLEEFYRLALEVIEKWQAEKAGEIVDRELEKDYLFFHGDGEQNHFRKEY